MYPECIQTICACTWSHTTVMIIMITNNHYSMHVTLSCEFKSIIIGKYYLIQAYIEVMQTQWDWLKQLRIALDKHLSHLTVYLQVSSTISFKVLLDSLFSLRMVI